LYNVNSLLLFVCSILGIIECGVDEQTVAIDIQSIFKSIQLWLTAFSTTGVLLKNQLSSIRLEKVFATEEIMWSMKWGLKGTADATIQAVFSSNQSYGQRQVTSKLLLPLELKTGSNKYAQLEHQGQVILYTLLLHERYAYMGAGISLLLPQFAGMYYLIFDAGCVGCSKGLLLYLPGCEFDQISAMSSHVRGLIQSRNQHASHMSKLATLASSNGAPLPPMLKNRRDCENCFQLHECILHHAAAENGTNVSR